MKKLSALLLLALGLYLIPALSAADKKATSKPTTPPPPQAPAKVDPKATTTTVAKDAKATPEPAKPIIGILIERKDSAGFLNLKVDGGNFVIVFLDKDKKEIEGDRSRAIIRFRKHLKNSQFILTRAADGKSLRSSGKPVDRPYIYPALPVLVFKEGQEEVSEAYTVQFNQPMPGDGEGTPIDQMTPDEVKKIAK